jgi:large subunit ribosomal protein L25
MSEIITLEAQPRTLTGKKVKQLRAGEFVPAIVYGPTQEGSRAIQIPTRDLASSLKAAGGTNLIEISVGKEKINVLVRDVQRSILKGDLLHVDFYAVDMNVAITAEVPVLHVGESELLESGQAMLITEITSVEVECLPDRIPSHLELDLSVLTEIGQALTVADLKAPEAVTILSDADDTLVRLDYGAALLTEEEEEEEAVVAAESEEVEVIRRGKEEEDEED